MKKIIFIVATIVGDSSASEQTLFVQDYDGTSGSSWDSFIHTTTEDI